MASKSPSRSHGEGSIYRSDNRTITIDRAIKRADGGRPLSIGPTKTGNRRDVEMTDMLLAALRRHRKQQAEARLAAGSQWTTDSRWADLVFTSEVGTPIDPSHARRDFKKICAHSGVPTLSLYEIRHTVASLMMDADVPSARSPTCSGTRTWRWWSSATATAPTAWSRPTSRCSGR